MRYGKNNGTSQLLIIGDKRNIVMNRLLGLYILFHLALLSHAQMIAEICVLDSASKKPIYGVMILDKETQTGTATNMEGCAQVIIIPNHTIIVSKDGYQTKELTVKDKMDIYLVPEEKKCKTKKSK